MKAHWQLYKFHYGALGSAFTAGFALALGGWPIAIIMTVATVANGYFAMNEFL